MLQTSPICQKPTPQSFYLCSYEGWKGQTWRVRPSHKQSKVIFYQRVAPKRKWCATPLFTYSNQGIFKQKGGRIWRGGGEKKSPCLELICFPNIFPTVAPLSLLPSTFHSLPELRSKKGIHERSSGTQESESRYISSLFFPDTLPNYKHSQVRWCLTFPSVIQGQQHLLTSQSYANCKVFCYVQGAKCTLNLWHTESFT